MDIHTGCVGSWELSPLFWSPKSQLKIKGPITKKKGKMAIRVPLATGSQTFMLFTWILKFFWGCWASHSTALLPCISYLVPCNKGHQSQQLKAASIYYLTASVGQVSGNSLAGSLWLRVSHRISVTLSSRAAVPEHRTRAQGMLQSILMWLLVMDFSFALWASL